MKSLKKLNAGWNCGIDQEGIKGLTLEELYAWDNKKIKDVSWMKSLKKLNAVDVIVELIKRVLMD